MTVRRRQGFGKIATCLTTIGLTGAAAGALASPLPSDLEDARKAFDEAQVRGDGPTLERLLAPGYILVNARGGRETKAQFIEFFTAQGSRLDPYQVEQPLTLSWEGGAVLGGITTLKGMTRGHPFKARIRFSDVWAKQQGRWQVIHTMVAPVTSP